MKIDCYICDSELDTEKGQIICLVPEYFKDEFLIYYLCRSCFLKTDTVPFNKWPKPKRVKKE